MRTYINQIDDTIIKQALTEDEYTHYASVAKAYYQIHKEKRDLEFDLKNKIKSRVIGELETVELEYVAYSDKFYVSYSDSNTQPQQQKSFLQRLFG